MTVYDEIRGCKGSDRCYGLAVGPVKPIVFDFPTRPHALVVTEQPSEGRSIEEFTKGMNEENLRGVPAALDALFEGKFYRAIKKKELYWTHFIKCPGTIRKRKEERETGPSGLRTEDQKLNIDACAEHFLRREIEELRPQLIVAVGSKASQFILDISESKIDWMEQLWKEIEAVASEHTWNFQPPTIGGAKALVFMHPSGSNPLRYFFLKLRPLLTPYLSPWL